MVSITIRNLDERVKGRPRRRNFAAAANGMAVVTRHEADFAGVGVDIINPWKND